eukprot:COSAG01_NODE_62741_length_283_cov_0.798913_1_plen_77_part_10
MLPALGEILRRWNIKLFWCPNHFQASQQATGESPGADCCGLQTDTLLQTADALYAAVPDFGGYLLKIGSEKQGGKPT